MARHPKYPGQPLRRGPGDAKHLPLRSRRYKATAPWLKPTHIAMQEARAKGIVGKHMGPNGPITLSPHLHDSDGFE